MLSVAKLPLASSNCSLIRYYDSYSSVTQLSSYYGSYCYLGWGWGKGNRWPCFLGSYLGPNI